MITLVYKSCQCPVCFLSLLWRRGRGFLLGFLVVVCFVLGFGVFFVFVFVFYFCFVCEGVRFCILFVFH